MTIRALAPHKEWVKTITNDNGKEFAGHKSLAKKLDCDVYFAHPYSSWERGLNEYTNKLLRQYFPKNKTLKNISQNYILDVVDSTTKCKFLIFPNVFIIFLKLIASKLTFHFATFL